MNTQGTYLQSAKQAWVYDPTGAANFCYAHHVSLFNKQYIPVRPFTVRFSRRTKGSSIWL